MPSSSGIGIMYFILPILAPLVWYGVILTSTFSIATSFISIVLGISNSFSQLFTGDCVLFVMHIANQYASWLRAFIHSFMVFRS